MKHVRNLIVVSMAGLVAGCAGLRLDWKDDSRPKTIPTATAQADSGSALLDVAFVSILVDPKTVAKPSTASDDASNVTSASVETARATENARGSVEQLWRWIDETAISPEIRASLKSNGLRVGRVHTQSEFSRVLDTIRRTPLDEPAKFMASASLSSDIAQSSQRIPCRLGRRIELPVRNPAAGEVATLVSIGGNTIGKTLSGPQPLFALTVNPNDATGVRVRMQPEIQFGQMRQTYVGADSALRIESRRDSWKMEELAFEMTMAEGGTIVVGASLPPFGLGEQMFTGKTADGDIDHVIAVLRVAKLPDMILR